MTTDTMIKGESTKFSAYTYPSQSGELLGVNYMDEAFLKLDVEVNILYCAVLHDTILRHLTFCYTLLHYTTLPSTF